MIDNTENLIVKFWDIIITEGVQSSSTPIVLLGSNIRNSPTTNNIISNWFNEAVIFEDSKFWMKNITLKFTLNELSGVSYLDSINRLKDSFYFNKWKITYYYRDQIMTLEAVIDWDIIFDLEPEFSKTATVKLIWEPFFTGSAIRTWSNTVVWDSTVITFDNLWHRISPIVTLNITGGNCESANIWNLIVQNNINNLDEVIIDYKNKTTSINAVKVKTFWGYEILQKWASLDLAFNQKEITPTYNTLSTWGPSSNSYVVGNSYATQLIWQTFTTIAWLNFIKEITFYWNHDSTYASVYFNLRIYTDIGKWTLLHSQDDKLWLWETTNDFVFKIDWAGVDISSYTDFYVEIEMKAIAWITTWHYFFRRVTPNYAGWICYLDWVAQADDIQIDIKWTNAAFVQTYENITNFDLDFTYNNKYI